MPAPTIPYALHQPERRQPLLVTVGGLPAVGKTTVARALAGQLRAAYLRIDSIETAVARAQGRFATSNEWEAPPGYAVGYDLAVDQLRQGLDVVAESVNPLGVSRDAWRDSGLRTGARVVEVEVVCSDTVEHRRRAEHRSLDIPGLIKPTWDAIVQREYEPWGRGRVVIDTATLGVEAAVTAIRTAAEV